MGLQVWLERDESCYLTPHGYFNQTVMHIEQKPLWNECTLDPGNGEDEYVIRSPWQHVRGG